MLSAGRHPGWLVGSSIGTVVLRNTTVVGVAGDEESVARSARRRPPACVRGMRRTRSGPGKQGEIEGDGAFYALCWSFSAPGS